MTRRYDIAIAGSGFAGSLMAMIAARLGRSVVLLEKGHHPRRMIGESSTPLSNLLLEEIAETYNLPALRPLTKWGTWQESCPQIACGLKRGFTFFHHDRSSRAAHAFDRQMLVAASPNDSIADTHWFRADFDHLLVQQACAAGVDFHDGCDIHRIHRAGSAWTLSCEQNGAAFDLQADFLIDATGPRGLLHRALSLRESALPDYPETSALYCYFTGVQNFGGAQVYTAGKPPYPPDSAAVHHVFDGGWMWLLQFNNGLTSVGFAFTDAAAKQSCLDSKEAAWHLLLDRLPEVKEQFRSAHLDLPLTHVPKLSFRSASIAGDGWAMLPSAAGFVDPLLSTGFPLALLGITRLGKLLERDWKSARFADGLACYAEATEGELLCTADLISALYANMADFATFRTLLLLYFAAASYAETARRLGRTELADSFLLRTDPDFAPEFRRITALARTPLDPHAKAILHVRIYRLIERFDVAGLCKRPADHCYPVRAADLFAGADKLHASTAEIEALLMRTGFFPTAN